MLSTEPKFQAFKTAITATSSNKPFSATPFDVQRQPYRPVRVSVRRNSSDGNLNSYCYSNRSSSNQDATDDNNDVAFVLHQPANCSLFNGDRGKDEEEYIEKVQEVSCPVSLIDEKHKNVLLSRLDTLRRHKEFCDVVLYAEQKEICCHKIILAAMSPCFYELFTATQDSLSLANSNNNGAAVVTGSGQLSTQNLAGVNQINGQTTGGKPIGRSGSLVHSKIIAVAVSRRSSLHTSDCGLMTSYSDRSSEKLASGKEQERQSKELESFKFKPEKLCANEACQTSPPPVPYSGDPISYYELTDLDYDSLEAIVHFAYTGVLEICNDQVAQLYKTAYALRVHTCIKACASYLTKTLSIKNCIGLRKCANRTNDSLLGNQIDNFILKNFEEIINNSSEFISLPCIQIDVFMSAEDRIKFKSDRKVGERILDFLQREVSALPEYVEFRMELLTNKPFLLYFDTDGSLQDCNDLDDNSSVGSCDLVQDYKKQNKAHFTKRSKQFTIGGHQQQSNGHQNFQHNHQALLAGQNQNEQVNFSSQTFFPLTVPLATNGTTNYYIQNPTLTRLSRAVSSDSVNSFASETDETEWKNIAISKNSDNYYVVLSIVKCKLTAISIRINDTPPFSRPGITDRLSLLLSKTAENFDDQLLAPLAEQRCNVGAVFLDNQLFVFGGNNRSECLKTVEIFDISCNKWSSGPPMLKERGRFGACVCNGKVYAVGGSDGSHDLDTCESYDPVTNQWQRIESRLRCGARCNNGAASVGKLVYCVGGWDGQAAVKTVDCYDPENGQWVSVSPMAVGRYQSGVCSWRDYILVAGGCDTWSCLSSVEFFDPITNLWRFLPPMIAARRGCGAAVMNDKLYVAGGSDGTQTMCSVEVLDLKELMLWMTSNCLGHGHHNHGKISAQQQQQQQHQNWSISWRTAPPLNMPRGNVRLVAAGQRLFAVGGFSGKLFSNTIEYLDEGSNEWRMSILSPSQTTHSSPITLGSSDPIVEDPAGEAYEEAAGID